MNMVRQWVAGLVEHEPLKHQFPMFAICPIPMLSGFAVVMALPLIEGDDVRVVGMVHMLN